MYHSGGGKPTEDAWLADACLTTAISELSWPSGCDEEVEIAHVLFMWLYRHLIEGVVRMVIPWKDVVVGFGMDSVVHSVIWIVMAFHWTIHPACIVATMAN